MYITVELWEMVFSVWSTTYPSGSFLVRPLNCLTPTWSQSQELLYDWWFTTSQFVLVPSPLRITTTGFFNWTFSCKIWWWWWWCCCCWCCCCCCCCLLISESRDCLRRRMVFHSTDSRLWGSWPVFCMLGLSEGQWSASTCHYCSPYCWLHTC
jgi:hypothetical protein